MKIILRLIPIILSILILLAGSAWGATYYVDTAADGDAGAGTSEAANVAWKTIAKVNASSFSAGDSILFKRGCCTWREQLTVPSSGSVGSPITFGAYGSGANPIINGADLIVGAWSQVAGWESIWTAAEQTGAAASDAANSGPKSFRDAIKSTSISKSVTKVKVLFTAYSTLTFNIDGASIGERDGTTSYDFAVAPSRLLFDTASTKDIAGGATAWSDELDFILDETKDYIVNVYCSEAFMRAKRWNAGSGSHSNIDTGTSDLTMVQAFTESGNRTDIIGGVTEIQGYSATANVWSTALELAGSPDMVLIDGALGLKQTSLAAVTSAGKWFWESNVLYLYSATDPSSTVVEYAVRSYGINTNGKNYLTIQNLSLKGTKNNGAGIGVNASQYITIDSVNASYNCYGGVLGLGLNHGRVTITGSTFEYNGASAFNPWDFDASNVFIGYLTFTYNTVRYNGWLGVQGLVGVNGALANSEIAYNTFHANGNDGVADNYSHQHAIYITGTDTLNSGVLIHHNIVYGNTEGSGIKMDAASGSVYNNLCYQNGYGGITAGYLASARTITVDIFENVCWGNAFGFYQQLDSAGTTNLNIYNNTFVSNTSKLRVPTYTREILLNTAIGAVNIKNNILSGSDGASHVEFGAVAQTGLTMDYNCFQYGNIFYDSASRNWAAWQGLGFEAHGINADPLLTSDYKLGPGSPCIDAGIDWGQTGDFEGKPKFGSAWDIGAYEFWVYGNAMSFGTKMTTKHRISDN